MLRLFTFLSFCNSGIDNFGDSEGTPLEATGSGLFASSQQLGVVCYAYDRSDYLLEHPVLPKIGLNVFGKSMTEESCSNAEGEYHQARVELLHFFSDTQNTLKMLVAVKAH